MDKENIKKRYKNCFEFIKNETKDIQDKDKKINELMHGSALLAVLISIEVDEMERKLQEIEDIVKGLNNEKKLL